MMFVVFVTMLTSSAVDQTHSNDHVLRC